MEYRFVKIRESSHVPKGISAPKIRLLKKNVDLRSNAAPVRY
jgi:hypothetical protein